MAISYGSEINAVVTPGKQVLSTNYVDLSSSGWAQQYLPDLMEKEAEVFGNRTISGFLAQVGAEEAMMSDQVVWSEQGRLHLCYTSSGTSAVGGHIRIAKDIDGNSLGTDTYSNGDHGIRANDIIIVADSQATVKCLVVNVASDGDLDITPYDATGDTTTLGAAGLSTATTAEGLRVLVIGSEFAKGTDARSSANEPKFKSFSNKPVILKDFYEVSGSDATSIGWVEVSGENGQNGYMWYLKAEGDTRARFADYVEMTMMFVNRATSLAMDDMLASMNSYGAGGTSYGVFDNSEDMALNLGFSGFRRGSYDFYKSDWKYLNDMGTRGAINDAATTAAIRGVIVPAGVSSVYDKLLGKNMKRPFLHVRYRASQTDNRRLKTWVTGSVGAATSALDAMQMHFLSERCLVTQGANNFMLMK